MIEAALAMTGPLPPARPGAPYTGPSPTPAPAPPRPRTHGDHLDHGARGFRDHDQQPGSHHHHVTPAPDRPPTTTPGPPTTYPVHRRADHTDPRREPGRSPLSDVDRLRRCEGPGCPPAVAVPGGPTTTA